MTEAGLIYRRAPRQRQIFEFKHALIQESASQSLLRSRRQQYHQRIAEVLEARFPEIVGEQPELLAHHYTEADLSAEAIRNWQRAGQHASARFAHAEAISHLTKALELVRAVPESTDRIAQELTLCVSLGPSLIATKGWAAAEVGETYARARELCQHLGDRSQLFRAVWGLWAYYIVRAEHNTSHELAEQLVSLAQSLDDSGSRIEAHQALGQALCCIGQFSAARKHLELSAALYDVRLHHSQISRSGTDLGVFCLSWLSHALWHLGYADGALTTSGKAVDLAQALSQPFSLVLALAYAAMLHQFRGEAHTAYDRAEAARVLSAEHGFEYYRIWAIIVQGWALAVRGETDSGVTHIRDGVAAMRATGAALRLPYYRGLLADACRRAGHATDGLVVLGQALTEANGSGESWATAELFRLKGALLLSLSENNQNEAERSFHHALEVARHQQAKALELRAAIALSELWRQQGRRTDAHQLLVECYSWFTEGFDTADLRNAKMLLDDLFTAPR